MSAEERKLIDQLEIVKSLIVSGFTLQESLRLSPAQAVQVPPSLVEDWRNVRQQILCGEVQGGATLAALIARLETDLEIQESYRKSIAMPIAQSLVCAAIFAATLVARIFYFAAGWGSTDSVAAILIVLAAVIQYRIYKHFTRENWVLDWVKILASLENRLCNGKTAQHAMKEIKSVVHPRIPQELLLMNPPVFAKRCGPLEESARETWTLIWQAHARGLALGAFIKVQRERLVKKILNHHARSTTKISFACLIPLYFLFFPACLMVMLGPLLEQLLVL